MRSLVVTGPPEHSIEDLPVPEPGPGRRWSRSARSAPAWPAPTSPLRIQSDLSDRGVALLQSIHPSPRNNARGGRAQVPAVAREAYQLVRGVDGE